MTASEPAPEPLLAGKVLVNDKIFPTGRALPISELRAESEVDHAGVDVCGRDLEEDRQRVNVVRRLGPDHKLYVEFSNDLRNYAIGTLITLHRAGTLHATVERKTKRRTTTKASTTEQSTTELPPLPPVPASWTSNHIRSLIMLSVVRSVDPFMRSAVLEGGWDPRRGVRVKTYFLGRCYWAYRDDYRHDCKEEVAAQSHLVRYDDPEAELEAIGFERRAPSPSPERTAIDRDWIRRLLEHAADSRAGLMVHLQAAGMSVAEIANCLDVEEKDVHNALRQLRRVSRRKTSSWRR